MRELAQAVESVYEMKNLNQKSNYKKKKIIMNLQLSQLDK